MKRWAILTVLLYALALILLTLPVILVAFGGWGLKSDSVNLADAAKMYTQWGYWLWLAVLATGQMLLLLLPINIAERRLPARRPLKLPVIVTTFFLANLLFAGIFSTLCALFTESAFEYFDVTRLFMHDANQPKNTGNSVVFTMIGTVIIFWIIWGIIFRRATKNDEPDALVKRLTRWLLRGSILELIIAVPSHVIVRRREDCCAPMGTFWGIATGISVMLLCFGPGVFYLFIERIRKMKPKADASVEK